jgi:hypothetical protein
MSKISVVCLCLLAAFNGCAGRLNVTEQMMWSTYPVITQSGMATGFVMEGKDRKRRSSSGYGDAAPCGPAGGQRPVIRWNPDRQLPGRTAGCSHPTDPAKARPVLRQASSLDLAAFPLQLPESVRAQVSMPTFLKESSIGSGLNSLRSGSEVFFLGFPDVLPGTPGAFPVLRSGRVASYPVRERMSEGLFLIDADVYPGDSGAPVFVAGPRWASAIGGNGRPADRHRTTRNFRTSRWPSRQVRSGRTVRIFAQKAQLLL